tara:strand:+ start:2789 stop:3280 length:492 start_codon:yes stop_codon:yes gene_type:complete
MVIDAEKVSPIVPPTALDVEAVTALLGRPPSVGFEVVVMNKAGEPVVIRNEPIMEDGRPMPTRFWLVCPKLCLAVARLEGKGGVKAAEAEVDQTELSATHSQYAKERDALIPSEYSGPRPSGGVGGTRRGVKCLHTHLAHYLFTGEDPVGAWIVEKLEEGCFA